MPPRIRKASRLDKLTPRHLKGREQTVKPATPGTTEQPAQEEVRQIAGELDALCRRLEGVHKRLPVASNEALMLLGEADMDVATEVRSVIECVLNDSLRPAVRDLRTAAEYRAPSGGEEREA